VLPGRRARVARRSRNSAIASIGVVLLFMASCTGQPPDIGHAGGSSGNPVSAEQLKQAQAKIKHVVIILQENRSFDSYFGTFPGADGIPMKNGQPTVCIPNPKVKAGCTKPFHDPADVNKGGPHQNGDAKADVDGGKMDGFVVRALKGTPYCNKLHPEAQICQQSAAAPDVMGWHDAREIPNYWAYAKQFVLQDHLFEPNLGWSEPAHLYLVSGWSARCVPPTDPMNCTSSIGFVDVDTGGRYPKANSYQWTDLTYLLHNAGVSWRYFVGPSTVNDCGHSCSRTKGTPEIWNPLPDFQTVHDDQQVNLIQPITRFFSAAKSGDLPQLSWILPDWAHSEHPPWPISDGQAWVTDAVNAVMRSPAWDSTAIFIAWDDWGGFYDHVVPPQVDSAGYGLRVPGIMISPYAKHGFIDHQTLSFDAYLKFVEDLFLGGQRLDPATDGRPDPRPVVREEVPELGDLLKEFDFSQPPAKPLILDPYPNGR
jgi:phospholipase C